jgi:hypothetical protein
MATKCAENDDPKNRKAAAVLLSARRNDLAEKVLRHEMSPEHVIAEANFDVAFGDRLDAIDELIVTEQALQDLYAKEEATGDLSAEELDAAIEARDEAVDDLIEAEFAYRRDARSVARAEKPEAAVSAADMIGRNQ